MLILLGMIFFFFFLRDFQLMVSVPDNNFLLSNQNTDRILV